MILIPSLEILAGRPVRLEGGPDGDPIVLGDDALHTAREMIRSGARFLHVVDLDAAFGTGNNDAVLAQLADAMVPFQVRGGIKTAERAEQLLSLGADRVVLGPLPFRDEAAARSLVERFGVRVVGTLDVRADRVLIGDDSEGIEFANALAILRRIGVQQVIYNSVEFAGEDAPLDLDKLSATMGGGAFRVLARCTVKRPGDITPLVEFGDGGLEGVILNHALAPDAAPFASLIEV